MKRIRNSSAATTIRRTAQTARPSRVRQDLLAATIASAKRLSTFALILEGDALAPSFLDGDLLTVAPAVQPLPGDRVVAKFGNHGDHGDYGDHYACMRSNADGDRWDNVGGFCPKGEYTTAGVVLDRTPREI